MNSTENSASKYYHVGGSLAHNAPSYVKRKADEDLYNLLKAGEFCYVLNSRQMGKSSLRVQTMQTLKAQGFICASIDISSIGSDVTPQQWYGAIINKLYNGLNLSELDWLEKRQSLSPLQQLSDFIENVILKEINKNIVIFFDEIDAVLSLKFVTDEFFAFIRACYNLRVDNPEYNRLTFVFLGVATPSDLIKDKERGQFNIGRAINLNGFELENVEPLAKGLESKVSNTQAVLEQVLYWTGGQPFLTQKVCELILSSPEPIPKDGEKEWVAQLVKEKVIKDWESKDDPQHLMTIRDRICSNEQRVIRLLGLYKKILQREDNKSGKVPADDSPEQWILRLSGLVVKKDDELRVYNRIYKRVFGKIWLNKELREWIPFATDMIDWFDSDCENKSLLLRETVLESALDWAKDKSLNDECYKYLIASLKLENKEIELALDAANSRKQDFEMGWAASSPDPEKLRRALEEERKKNKQLQEDLEVAKLDNKNLTKERNRANFKLRLAQLLIAFLVIPAILGGISIYSDITNFSRHNSPSSPSHSNTDSPTNKEPPLHKPEQEEDCSCPSTQT